MLLLYLSLIVLLFAAKCVVFRKSLYTLYNQSAIIVYPR